MHWNRGVSEAFPFFRGVLLPLETPTASRNCPALEAELAGSPATIFQGDARVSPPVFSSVPRAGHHFDPSNEVFQTEARSRQPHSACACLCRVACQILAGGRVDGRNRFLTLSPEAGWKRNQKRTTSSPLSQRPLAQSLARARKADPPAAILLDCTLKA